MGFMDSETKCVPSDKTIDKKYEDLLDQQIDSATCGHDSTEVKDIGHKAPPKSDSKSPMHTGLMNWTTLLEEMDEVQDALAYGATEQEITDQPAEAPEASADDKDLLDELNKLFTPVLVMQGFENDIANQANEQISEAGVLTERNIISFDDETRMSQLVNVCAKLIAKKKNTPSWQAFKKAAAIKKQASINIQKEEYDGAKALAQKYLVMVSTTNNSSVARDAANDLLPQTQH